jgi:hypothetical protein
MIHHVTSSEVETSLDISDTEAPNPYIHAPENVQPPTPKLFTIQSKIEAWSFSGRWSFGLGDFFMNPASTV